jgi:hypothetical protein
VTPARIKRFHGVMGLVWTALIFPTVTVWGRSVAWVGFLSIYALMASHFLGWIESRLEITVNETADGE